MTKVTKPLAGVKHISNLPKNLPFKDRDIATIEALIDTLLDNEVIGRLDIAIINGHLLTRRMYNILYPPL